MPENNIDPSSIQIIPLKKPMPKPNAMPDTRMFRSLRKKNMENNGALTVPISQGNRSGLNNSLLNESDYSILATPDIHEPVIIGTTG
jgi:hypothetical protein